MRIDTIEIMNYRNLDGVKVLFNHETNYIVGENNIGKSNFLALINTICDAKGFVESDFQDESLPIIVNLVITLNISEYGVFGDSFSPADDSKIRLRIVQDIHEVYPQVVNSDSSETIQAKSLRKLNYIKYDTSNSSRNDLKFDRNKGAGVFLEHMIEKHVTTEDSFLDQNNIDSLIEHLNTNLKRIKAFKDFDISASVSSNTTDILSKLIYLTDANSLPISNTGSGIQFMATATLSVFAHILNLYKSKTIPFEETIFVNEDGQKILPLILAIDEPEAHLHPFMQRAILGYYKRILKNLEPEFLKLIKYCFNIDGLDGQLIIVTHSTDALIDSHKNIIRFFYNQNKTQAISGMGMNIKSEIEKHLFMHFSDIKEAFYSKCVLIVEGETEYGCIANVAKKLDIAFDEYGICFVNAQGEKSISKLQRLFDHFRIPTVVIYDSDVKSTRTTKPNEFFTSEICFEMDIVSKLIEMNRLDILKDIVLQLETNADNKLLDEDFVKKPFKKINYDVATYMPKKLSDLDTSQMDEYKSVYFAWYYTKKGILIGKIIGELIPSNCIPSCYVDAVTYAKEVAKP